jgi:hypothetical protein
MYICRVVKYTLCDMICMAQYGIALQLLTPRFCLADFI